MCDDKKWEIEKAVWSDQGLKQVEEVKVSACEDREIRSYLEE